MIPYGGECGDVRVAGLSRGNTSRFPKRYTPTTQRTTHGFPDATLPPRNGPPQAKTTKAVLLPAEEGLGALLKAKASVGGSANKTPTTILEAAVSEAGVWIWRYTTMLLYY